MMTARDIAEHRKAKRNEWSRDKQAILDGKLRPEDMSLAHQIKRGPKRRFDFSRLEAAIKDDDWTWLNG
jgi:hypothetical protein